MIVRIVRLTFRPDAVDAFLSHFDAAAPKIRATDGCQHLDLWRATRYPNICTTHSRWASRVALDAYRHSDLFRSTWAQVKPLFAAPPQATSYTVARAHPTDA
ncbi:putative quinol monooxygenase [Salisaeta longa]|uniref:putative quinol monooxygenase n=1 Tax=Salisaeta longa TaxID=503170 RepID=UPI0004187ECF|nr:putative quinol monooxygenase [Salisaeta longa]